MTHTTTRFIFSLLFACSISILKAQTPTYLDSSASIDDRIDDLLSRMTLKEKAGQMTQADHNAINNTEEIKTYFLGSILSGGGSDPAQGNDPIHWANLYDSFQQKALENRLRIPLIYGIDAVHGHSNVIGAVIFPHNIGLGATRNPELVEEAARITAIEVAATGIDWTFAPCIAVPRDERWGRTYEGFGETPELAGLLGAAAVRGFQNDSLNMPTSIVACAKHYVGDGGTAGGDDQGNTILIEEELRAIHLPGYISAIENDVKTIMASYNSWNGQKMHGHKYLLTDVLKGELGFKGFIVSDWAGIDQLPGNYVSDIEASINAGIDMVMVPNNYTQFFTSLVSLVNQNKISMERIDDAVCRILKVKFELGLFERPMTDRSYLSLIGSENHRAVARQCVRESQVLLKKNDNILPLPKENIKVLVAGEHADDIGLQCGGWTIQWQGAKGEITTGTTILDGLQKVAPDVEFVYSPSGDFNDIDADYAIVVIGEQPYAEGAGDVDDLTVNKSQINMVRKIKQRGIPVITLLISGRPMIIDPVLHNSDIFIASWLPGTEADGIAEILFGDYLPKGLLPMTFPISMEQIPINFGDEDYDPLFAYGFGITDISDSQAGSPPVFQSAMLTEDGFHIELTFNKSMIVDETTNAQFSVMKNNSTNIEVINFELCDFSNNIIELGLGDEISEDDILTVTYVSGNLTSVDGSNLDLFLNQPVINFRQYLFAAHSLPGRIEAEDYAAMSGVQTENTSDTGGGLNVGWIDNGDWMEYYCNFESAGTYVINFRTACLNSSGRIKFLVNGEELFSRNIPITNGWQNWITVSETAEFAKGFSTIRIYAEKGGFNINWFEFLFDTSIEEQNHHIPQFKLEQNYPNPFNSVTKIGYAVNQASFIKIIIYNELGQEVKALVNENKPVGHYETSWDGTDKFGNMVSTGIYFYQIHTSRSKSAKKMLLLE